ncbi:uncharacterized protein K460DRAFT_40684 [Cucurbitaria berberidis CBS 394.84]|uniref:Uncharacterized protein n=1 Tax=Cucurbitaria berberidis CBS 394.84 TaxID=1168544 RepID=A0A9P4GS71_9PLEO|nr:uncharacterized protein K460DRAFT_40684 [Cucurbitaria berberidis CBS 394.84]KAF1851763.1 hypothetical protein K460DRAFT_40684 [Cucurbitaria berberidis CBS 394.84]
MMACSLSHSQTRTNRKESVLDEPFGMPPTQFNISNKHDTVAEASLSQFEGAGIFFDTGNNGLSRLSTGSAGETEQDTRRTLSADISNEGATAAESGRRTTSTPESSDQTHQSGTSVANIEAMSPTVDEGTHQDPWTYSTSTTIPDLHEPQTSTTLVDSTMLREPIFPGRTDVTEYPYYGMEIGSIRRPDSRNQLEPQILAQEQVPRMRTLGSVSPIVRERMVSGFYSSSENSTSSVDQPTAGSTGTVAVHRAYTRSGTCY